jgi:hypothetical protein
MPLFPGLGPLIAVRRNHPDGARACGLLIGRKHGFRQRVGRVNELADGTL